MAYCTTVASVAHKLLDKNPPRVLQSSRDELGCGGRLCVQGTTCLHGVDKNFWFGYYLERRRMNQGHLFQEIRKKQRDCSTINEGQQLARDNSR